MHWTFHLKWCLLFFTVLFQILFSKNLHCDMFCVSLLLIFVVYILHKLKEAFQIEGKGCQIELRQEKWALFHYETYFFISKYTSYLKSTIFDIVIAVQLYWLDLHGIYIFPFFISFKIPIFLYFCMCWYLKYISGKSYKSYMILNSIW